MYRLVSTALKSFWDHDTLLLKSFLSHPNFHLGQTDMYVIFFCIDMKRKQEGKAERNRCCLRGQRWHLVVLVLVPATPTPWEKSSSRRTTRFSLQSRLERWTPLLQQQAPFHATAITQHCYCQRGSQSLYKYTSLGDPHHSCPGIELLFQYR